MGAQITSNWSKMARIKIMNVAHLQVVPTRHKVMGKAMPMEVGTQVQIHVKYIHNVLLLNGNGILLYRKQTLSHLWFMNLFFLFK
jgi:hypothetical protein